MIIKMIVINVTLGVILVIRFMVNVCQVNNVERSDRTKKGKLSKKGEINKHRQPLINDLRLVIIWDHISSSLC